ncbi:MAG: zinc-ribbon domain-containing protein, partial [Oscillospiraceae bacterium]|nr:zinc-ribbon domain-containing protein [Oscillospiraceae bacterium]
MICKNCGKENEDGVSFCASCGEALEEEETITEKRPSYGKLFTKKNLTIVSLGAAVVLVLILVLSLMLRNEAERAVDDLYEAVVKYDYDTVVGLMPPAVVESVKERWALEDSELKVVDS